MQLQTFITSTLLLSGLASAVTLPRANEAAAVCGGDASECYVDSPPLCCNGYVCLSHSGSDGVSVAILYSCSAHSTLAHRSALNILAHSHLCRQLGRIQG